MRRVVAAATPALVMRATGATRAPVTLVAAHLPVVVHREATTGTATATVRHVVAATAATAAVATPTGMIRTATTARMSSVSLATDMTSHIVGAVAMMRKRPLVRPETGATVGSRLVAIPNRNGGAQVYFQRHHTSPSSPTILSAWPGTVVPFGGFIRARRNASVSNVRRSASIADIVICA